MVSIWGHQSHLGSGLGLILVILISNCLWGLHLIIESNAGSLSCHMNQCKTCRKSFLPQLKFQLSCQVVLLKQTSVCKTVKLSTRFSKLCSSPFGSQRKVWDKLQTRDVFPSKTRHSMKLSFHSVFVFNMQNVQSSKNANQLSCCCVCVVHIVVHSTQNHFKQWHNPKIRIVHHRTTQPAQILTTKMWKINKK